MSLKRYKIFRLKGEKKRSILNFENFTKNLVFSKKRRKYNSTHKKWYNMSLSKEKKTQVEAQLKEILKTNEDWEMTPIDKVPNAFITKLPPKAKSGSPTLAIQILILKEDGTRLTQKGLYITKEEVLNGFETIFGGRNEHLHDVFGLIQKVNGKPSKTAGSSNILTL